ncbi:uncharacterized protein LOC127102964 [Lathyrus oleraceus]|uniref:uncharacterized protein LOC127102964 n=1 Tax=Pisum sativum TaxID=3888 RepID=UPI0021D34EDC|nr:uncharacterized protein LOC127102964 [Pisum sativum]
MDFIVTPISNPYSQDVKLYKDEAYVRDLKGLSEQVRNDYIISSEEKLDSCLAQEAAEKAKRETKVKAAVEAAAKEAAEKADAEVATRENAEAEAALAAEAAQNASEDATKTSEVALTQRGSSTTDLLP